MCKDKDPVMKPRLKRYVAIAVILLASIGLQAKVVAQEGEESTWWVKAGQFRGLLDATCFYYKAGHLGEKDAMKYLNELQDNIDSSFAGGGLFTVLQEQVLREFPGCRKVWPK